MPDLETIGVHECRVCGKETTRHVSLTTHDPHGASVRAARPPAGWLRVEIPGVAIYDADGIAGAPLVGGINGAPVCSPACALNLITQALTRAVAACVRLASQPDEEIPF